MIQYFLNNEPCSPKNKADIKFRIDHSDRSRVKDFEMTVDNLIFVREDKKAIEDYIAQFGRFYGMPFSVQFGTGQIIQYYIDFTHSATTWNEIEFNAKVKRYKANFNFFDRAKALGFMPPLINWVDSDFNNIRYVVIPEQQPLYFVTLALAFYNLTQLITQSILDVQEGIADVQEAAIPVGIPPAPNVGAIVSASIKLAARVARLAALTVAMVQLLTTIIEMVMPKVRKFATIQYIHMIRKGCEALGYTLDASDIPELQPLHFLGVPERALDGKIIQEIFAPMSLAYTWGHPSAQDSISTLGDAIDKLETLFNLKTTVSNGVVRIQKMATSQTNNTPIPLAYDDQPKALNNRKFNDEFWKRKVLLWSKDTRDMFTYDDKVGHLVELDTSIISAPDPQLRLLKGAERIENSFAMGSVKKELTAVEKFLKNVLAPAVDLFTGGGLTQTIENRVNILQITSQYYTVNKLLWQQGEFIASDHLEWLGANKIVDKWHGSETVANRNKEVVEGMPIRMDEEKFLALANNKFVTLSNGETGEIVSVEWSEEDAYATATLLLNSQYNINIQQTTIYNAGNP
jgi:hypothetical protein